MHAASSCSFSIAIAISVIFCAIGCSAQCTPNYPWDPIPEQNYDRNLSSINNPAGRPLGFTQAVIEYSDNENPIRPCIQVTGAADRRIEVMAESDPPGSILCMRDQSNTNPTCLAQIYECRQATANDVFFEFYCDADSCDESSVTFWYRFVVSEDPAVLDPELWCNDRDTGEYPTSLNNMLPPDKDLAPAPPGDTGAATSLAASALTTLVIVLINGFLTLVAH
ncbi:uncharacterized protein [Diadema setosum]|uniref:uncharacterized protein n=1 Tax=Diadema setosum TaxID=31175 RepID=UPI003B3A985F